MAITYEEALATLNSMFTSPWTTDSLDSVLRHFEGHMENTIEAILSHGDGNPEALIQQLASGNGGSAAASSDGASSASGGGGSISVDEELARQLAAEEEKGSKGGGGGGGGSPGRGSRSNGTGRPKTSSGGGGKKGRGTPTNLPPDFLRIPGYKYAGGSSSGGGGGFQTDEQLARMLQDEMLQQELASNKEFAHLAGGGRRGSRAAGYPTGVPGRGFGAGAFGGGGQGQQAEGPNIMDKLSEMGEQAKRRLGLMAAQFNAQRQQGSMNPSQRNVAAQEQRGLLDDNMGGNEEEVSFLGGGGGGGAAGPQHVEMRTMSPPGSKKSD